MLLHRTALEPHFMLGMLKMTSSLLVIAFAGLRSVSLVVAWKSRAHTGDRDR